MMEGEEPVAPPLAGDPGTWATGCSRELPDALVALRYGTPLPDFTVLVRRAAR